MSKTQIFIDKARAVHGDRYGYDRSVYVRSRDKVVITCAKHGDFEQAPDHHLAGKGCTKCGIESRAAKSTQKAKDSFIAKARAAHGDRYDYSETVYVIHSENVIITCKKHGAFEKSPHNHLKGQGCAKCTGMHRHSTQEWVEKAIAVHGNRYGYERVVYVRNNDKIIITCKQHGDFEQMPNSHLSGSGCIKCGFEEMAVKLSQEAKDSFIEKACAIHGDKYEYLKTVYARAHDKVIITCKIHGDFEQTPDNHLVGQGCPKCGIEAMAIKREEFKDSFIARARTAHGDRYDYGRTVYVGADDKVIITCAEHGDFDQTPSNHLRGRGCYKCGKESMAVNRSQEAKGNFIEKSRAVHGDRYSYGLAAYVRANDKVTITCKKHGDFEQAPKSHLNGHGCPSCPQRYDQPTNLYLMHNGLGKVKVGYSIDTDRRISQLNQLAPFKAELLETWTLPDTPTVRKIEGKVHRKLAKYHAGLSGFDGATEWFNTTPKVAKCAILKALSGTEVLGYSEANSLQLALI